MSTNKRTIEKSLAWQRGIQYAMSYHDKVTNSESYGNYFTLNRFATAFASYLSNLPKDHVLLDLGTGTGVISKLLQDQSLNVVGLDISQDMLAIQKHYLSNSTLVRGSVFQLPFKASSFDAVVSRWCLGHFPDWLKIVISVHNILKDGGFFIFDFANEDNLSLAKKLGDFDEKVMKSSSDPNDPQFIALCSSIKLEAFLKSIGFTIKQIIPCGIAYENYILAQILNEKYPEYTDQLEVLFRSKPGKLFLEWLDTALSKKIPLHYARRMLIVAQKQ